VGNGVNVSIGDGGGGGRSVTDAVGGGGGRIVKDALGDCCGCCGFSVCVTDGQMTWSAVHCVRVGSQHWTGNTVGKGLRDRGDGVGQTSDW
jgi:hypothetical protein